ncbi:AMIN-like domain-containing (lipo)protein [Isoptericola aurantiacus]|uniref:AMIN-like domain-containing (lipo)protein n=1 Tax=Isoptericola aurantiacus TaxID=3377839 RepID=UPI00383B46F7
MRTLHRRRTLAVLLAGGAALLVAGCDGADLPGYGTGGEPAASATATEPTDPGTSSPPASDEESAEPTDAGTDDAASDEPDEPFEGGTALAEAEPGDGAMLTVTDVRAAAHDGYDRVVFELDGEGTPGWRVEYVDEALDDGSGNPVEVDGDAVLQVVLTGTAMPMDSGVTEYGGDPVDGPGTSIDQVVYRFVFEGQTTAFVGVDGEPRPFRVFGLDDPARVVVDVGH